MFTLEWKLGKGKARPQVSKPQSPFSLCESSACLPILISRPYKLSDNKTRTPGQKALRKGKRYLNGGSTGASLHSIVPPPILKNKSWAVNI